MQYAVFEYISAVLGMYCCILLQHTLLGDYAHNNSGSTEQPK